MGDLPRQARCRASPLAITIILRVKLHQIHRLELTAAAQRLDDTQQRNQRDTERSRRRHFTCGQHVEIDSQIQAQRVSRFRAVVTPTKARRV